MKNNKLIQARKEAGLTQEELAKKIGQKISAVGRWESGVFKPTEANLKKIAEATGKPLSFFIEDNLANHTDSRDNNDTITRSCGTARSRELEEIRKELRNAKEALTNKIEILILKMDKIIYLLERNTRGSYEKKK